MDRLCISVFFLPFGGVSLYIFIHQVFHPVRNPLLMFCSEGSSKALAGDLSLALNGNVFLGEEVAFSGGFCRNKAFSCYIPVLIICASIPSYPRRSY
jgi:hypothetical protein